MRVKQIRITIILGLISLIGIVAIQVYWLFTTWNMQQEKLDENIWSALKQTSLDISAMHQCQSHDLNTVFVKTETCYVVDVSCNFSVVNLTHFVQKNFNAFGINIEHELAIYNCDINQLEYIGKYTSSGDLMDKNGSLNYCLDDETNELVYFFTINISGKDVYLLKKMQLWLALSLIVIIILCFFTYAIFSFYRQKQLSELQKDFINNMTHEFKTPISSINIASDVLINDSNDQIPSRFKNYAQIIKQENTRLNNLVENVLRTARIEKSKTIMEIEELNLHNTINDIFQNNSIHSADKIVTINKNLTANNPIIFGDKLHLTNILLNLVDNAIKYNSEVVNIELTTKKDNNYLYLFVKDNGIGITPKHQKMVFRKFYRVPTGNLHDVKGFGLGLFYVKEVCSAHRWKINLESELNKGTCFTIKIKTKK